MVDQIAAYYDSKKLPVILLEQSPFKDRRIGNRYDRFYTAWKSSTYTDALPLVMVESGYQILTGGQSFYNAYRRLIDPELNRTPLADIDATYKRVGNHLEFQVLVTNRTSRNGTGGFSLSTQNNATVNVITYETFAPTDPIPALTHRYDRAVVSQSITDPLDVDQSATYTNLQTGDLTGVNWNNLHSVAFVDYRLSGTNTGPYDMLQAARVEGFRVAPASLGFLVDWFTPESQTLTANIAGDPAGTSWSVSVDQGSRDWLTVNPTTGTVGSMTSPIVVQITVDSGKIPRVRGTHTATLTFSAVRTGLEYHQDVPVRVEYTQIFDTFAPNVGH